MCLKGAIRLHFDLKQLQVRVTTAENAADSRVELAGREL
jgi:hypothetical protein